MAQQTKTNPKATKTFLIVIGVILFILLSLLGILYGLEAIFGLDAIHEFLGVNESQDVTQQSEPIQTAPNQLEPGEVAPEDYPEDYKERTDKVDSIIMQAREDAKTATTEQLEEAYAYIHGMMADDYHKLYADDATMEQAMYYGALMEYGLKESIPTLSDVGMDTVQAIKYVYRGVETIEHNSTVSNLEQIIKGINKFVAESNS